MTSAPTTWSAAIDDFDRRAAAASAASDADSMSSATCIATPAVVLRTYKLGESDRIVVLLTERERQGAGRRQGRAQDEVEVRRPARADEPRAAAAVPRAASSTSSARPSRSSRCRRCWRRSTGRRRAWPCWRPSISWRWSASRTRSSTGCWSACCARSPSARRRWSCRRSTGSCWPPRACGPQLDACVRCGETEPDVALVAFDLDEGGVLCRTCRSGAPISRRRRWGCCATSSAAGSTRRSPCAESPATHEVGVLATKALEHHIERRLRTVAMFEH